MRKIQPIGIFDSGIGGLTIARAINKLLPDERLIFFGDTIHLPYGDKSSKAIRYYSKKILIHLIEKQVKLVVIACNSASSNAFSYLKKQFGNQVILVNVIDPVVKHCVKNLRCNKIGVIGTKATIQSRAYPKRIKMHNNNIKVASAATPLLAPMIEEGFFNNNISKTIIHTYLSKKHMDDIRALILACTHYPLIKKEINEYYKGKVIIVDAPEVIANNIKSLLQKYNLLNDLGLKPAHHFYVSDFTHSFQKTTQIFFSREIKLEQYNIWD